MAMVTKIISFIYTIYHTSIICNVTFGIKQVCWFPTSHDIPSQI